MGGKVMQTTGSWVLRERVRDRARSEREAFQFDQVEALDHAMIADLSNDQIRQMTSGELVRVIQAAPLDLMSEGCRQRLLYSDRLTQERLVFLARFCCQNQISRTVKSRNR